MYKTLAILCLLFSCFAGASVLSVVGDAAKAGAMAAKVGSNATGVAGQVTKQTSNVAGDGVKAAQNAQQGLNKSSAMGAEKQERFQFVPRTLT